mmetsp:Transcript_96428/g.215930  ORF Transcript_96428/g.215930 Transcript_96428/m.215930 type:complete len:219 (-) Transcript_96428:220-876(-)
MDHRMCSMTSEIGSPGPLEVGSSMAMTRTRCRTCSPGSLCRGGSWGACPQISLEGNSSRTAGFLGFARGRNHCPRVCPCWWRWWQPSTTISLRRWCTSFTTGHSTCSWSWRASSPTWPYRHARAAWTQFVKWTAMPRPGITKLERAMECKAGRVDLPGGYSALDTAPTLRRMLAVRRALDSSPIVFTAGRATAEITSYSAPVVAPPPCVARAPAGAPC